MIRYNRYVLFILGCLFTYLLIKFIRGNKNEIQAYRPPRMKALDTPVDRHVDDIDNDDRRIGHIHYADPFYGNIYSKNVINYQWKAKVIQLSKGKWVEEKCQIRADFKRTMLMSPVETPIFVYDSSKDHRVSDSVLRFGTWDEKVVQKLYSILATNLDLVFIDIGSNIGVFSLAAAMAGNRVIAVDCCRGNIMRLCASMRAGKLREQMTLIHNAVSDTRGDFQPPKMHGNDGNVYQIEENVVDSIILDDLLSLFVGKVEAVVRIDVKDFEAKVLAGAERFFKEVSVKYLLLDIQTHKGKETFKTIISFLERYNMDVQHEGNYDRADINAWPDKILCKKRNTKAEF